MLWGSDYLRRMRQRALQPDMVGFGDDLTAQLKLCGWIGRHVPAINQQLQAHLEACAGCFAPAQRQPIEIYAAPLNPDLGIDALCNIQAQPTTLLIDVGRVAPGDWLAVVAHEYAHAHLQSPGHDRNFAQTLGHLCLGLGLGPVPALTATADWLKNWPPTPSCADSRRFWQGAGTGG